MKGSKIVEDGSRFHRQCAADLLREASVRGRPEEVLMAAIRESLSGGEESNSLVSIETIHCTIAMHLRWLNTFLMATQFCSGKQLHVV